MVTRYSGFGAGAWAGEQGAVAPPMAHGRSSRQRGHRRFCRRSQLQNAWSQRRHAAYPACGLSFGARRWGPFRGPWRLMTLLSGARLSARGTVSALTPYRPPPLRTEAWTRYARETVDRGLRRSRTRRPFRSPATHVSDTTGNGQHALFCAESRLAPKGNEIESVLCKAPSGRGDSSSAGDARTR
jgi:hypothetical protein